MPDPYSPPGSIPGVSVAPAPTPAPARWSAATDRLITGLVALALMVGYQHFGIATPAGPDADAKALVAAIEKRLDEIAEKVQVEPTPDRLTVAAQAYLRMRPKACREVAAGIREGRIAPDKYSEAIATANQAASRVLAEAIQAESSPSMALDHAADAMEGLLK